MLPAVGNVEAFLDDKVKVNVSPFLVDPLTGAKGDQVIPLLPGQVMILHANTADDWKPDNN